MRLVAELFKLNKMVFRFNRSIIMNSFHKSWQKERPACLFHPFAYNLINENKDYMENIDKDMNAVS